MICSPCLADMHEFCRDDVRDCGCDCTTWYGFTSLDDAPPAEDEDDAPDDWRVGQDRYERRVSGD